MTAALCILALALQDPDSWVEKLGSDDIADREEAQAELEKAGVEILPRLEQALAKSKDAEIRARLEQVIASIRRAELDRGIVFEVLLPEQPPTLREVRGNRFEIRIRITNHHPHEVRLWPYLDLTIKDWEGAELKPSTYIGRWGMRHRKCFLAEVPFWSVEPGETKEISTGLRRFDWAYAAIEGWRLPSAGKYTFEFHWEYDREAFNTKCSAGCAGHAALEAVWNRALEVERTYKIVLEVKE